MTEEFVSYACYFRLTRKHKWRRQMTGHGPDVNELEEQCRRLLPAYHAEGKTASYAIVIADRPMTLPNTLWNDQLMDILETQRRIIHVPDTA
ncbi:hypothetical protein LCGC14_0276000 [marine sediment metagenome]|uniref:Uncharacterized protein n=1 Tax=marine sediment metagenome TaxID=412755 RepID=A0A0F9X2W1_9ZZZZ